MLCELLATDERRAFEFFFVHLRDVSEPEVADDELLYNASVLAHYAQVSTAATEGLPMLSDLSALCDQFVLNPAVADAGEMMETAAAQCLVLAGFFEDQMRRRHQISWYSTLGASFFDRAAGRQKSEKKARLLHALSQHFEPWRQRHARLSRELHDQRFLLPPPASC